MDEIRINEDVLAALQENSLEATLQGRILKTITQEPIKIINETMNKAVLEMARKYDRDVYWVCANFVPKIRYNSVMAEPSNCFRATMDVVIEFIPANMFRYGKG